MIRIGIGLKKINSLSLLLMIIVLYPFLSCERQIQNKFENSDGEPIQILMNDTLNLEVHWHDNGFIKSVKTLNKLGVENGFQLEYYPNGVLKEKFFCKNGEISGEFWKYNDSGEKIYFSNYINGKKTGDTYEFYNNQFLKSHFLFEDGNAIYFGYYEGGKKQINSPVPVFQDEKIRSDSIYEVKITFPFPFKGDLEIYFNDTIKFEKEYMDKYNLKLTITNFNDSWKKYDMLLEYTPTENDSLVWTEQVYNRTIRIE